ncbi:transketolase [Mesorhizobium sp. BE184]|uniref:transketolase n=1 Tax=Mesorhizobium sp. BE184 TaxID=2817714 RepID=UPI002863C266|nr:transketolase [Mesorhizobium sp. BE184]MDR7031661.1 transketolase [Mesorhizobium sp. BE184]
MPIQDLPNRAWATSEQLAAYVRLHALQMTHLGRSSHVGSAFSIADILAVLYADVLDVSSDDPKRQNRDRFILSKGHSGAALYATLAECGFMAVDYLKNHYQNGSVLSGHISHKGVPGVELSTGSLGHGLSVGAGMALSAKLKGEKHRVFVLMSDGECDEGSVWEALLLASHRRLDNLVAVIDYNKLQSLASVQDTLALEPFNAKLTAFGWTVHEVDGHDHSSLREAFSLESKVAGKPTVVLAHTTKGKGVSFMENKVLWHYRTAQGEEYENAVAELKAKIPAS